MQVPRFWRMKAQRYRLTGVRDTDGNIEFINRPLVEEENVDVQIKEVPCDVDAKQPAA